MFFVMKTLVARLKDEFMKAVRKEDRSGKEIVGEEEMLIAKGREQFQRLLDKGLSIPIARV
jgi:hypothetical protein